MCQDISKNQNGTEFWDDRFLSMAQCEFGFKVLSVFSYNLFSDIMWKRSAFCSVRTVCIIVRIVLYRTSMYCLMERAWVRKKRRRFCPFFSILPFLKCAQLTSKRSVHLKKIGMYCIVPYVVQYHTYRTSTIRYVPYVQYCIMSVFQNVRTYCTYHTYSTVRSVRKDPPFWNEHFERSASAFPLSRR